jgi:hypothetical protein
VASNPLRGEGRAGGAACRVRSGLYYSKWHGAAPTTGSLASYGHFVRTGPPFFEVLRWRLNRDQHCRGRMSRGPQRFKQRELTRAIKAAVAAGLTAYRIEIVNGIPAIKVSGNVDDPKDDGVGSWDQAIAELESHR